MDIVDRCGSEATSQVLYRLGVAQFVDIGVLGDHVIEVGSSVESWVTESNRLYRLQKRLKERTKDYETFKTKTLRKLRTLLIQEYCHPTVYRALKMYVQNRGEELERWRCGGLKSFYELGARFQKDQGKAQPHMDRVKKALQGAKCLWIKSQYKPGNDTAVAPEVCFYSFEASLDFYSNSSVLRAEKYSKAGTAQRRADFSPWYFELRDEGLFPPETKELREKNSASSYAALSNNRTAKDIMADPYYVLLEQLGLHYQMQRDDLLGLLKRLRDASNAPESARSKDGLNKIGPMELVTKAWFAVGFLCVPKGTVPLRDLLLPNDAGVFLPADRLLMDTTKKLRDVSRLVGTDGQPLLHKVHESFTREDLIRRFLEGSIGTWGPKAIAAPPLCDVSRSLSDVLDKSQRPPRLDTDAQHVQILDKLLNQGSVGF